MNPPGQATRFRYRESRPQRARKRVSPLQRYLIFAATIISSLLVLASVSYSTIAYLAEGRLLTRRAKTGTLQRLASSAMAVLRGTARPTEVEYFTRLEDWVSATVVSPSGAADRLGVGEWTCVAGGADPGAMRVWKQTLSMSDYDLTFRARTRSGGVGWAVRATDAQNLYGFRLIPSHPERSQAAVVEHFVRVNGHEGEHAKRTLYFNVFENAEYRIRVKVRGDRVSVTIDSQNIGDWKLAGLNSGAVAFFALMGDSPTIHWARITERDSMLGKLLGVLSVDGDRAD